MSSMPPLKMEHSGMKALEAYRILRLSPDSNADAVRSAYRSLLKKLHPDLAGRRGDAAQLERVIEAFRFLSDHGHLHAQDTRRGAWAGRGADTTKGRRANTAATRPADTAQTRHADAARSGMTRGRRRAREADAGAKGTAGRYGPADAHGTARRRPDIFELGDLVVSSEHPETRAFAAKSLGNSGRKWTAAFLRNALRDPSDVVVMAAVRALGQLGVVQCGGEFASLFVHGSDELRHAILDAIESSGRPASFRSAVLEALKLSHGDMRRRALRLFAQTSREEAQ
jgi:curved DNA-binding protein CbpA